MSLSAPVLDAQQLRDDIASRPVTAREIRYEGLIWDVAREHVDLGPAGTVRPVSGAEYP